MSKDHPAATHATDQLGALLRDIVPVLKAYREELTKAGFPEDQVNRFVARMEARLMRAWGEADRGG